MWKCGRCNTELRWNNDFGFDELGYEGEGISSLYSCDKCGVEVEVNTPLNE